MLRCRHRYQQGLARPLPRPSFPPPAGPGHHRPGHLRAPRPRGPGRQGAPGPTGPRPMEEEPLEGQDRGPRSGPRQDAQGGRRPADVRPRDAEETGSGGRDGDS